MGCQHASLYPILHTIHATKVNDAATLIAPLLEKTLRISDNNQNMLCSDEDNPEKNGNLTRSVAGAARGATHVLLMALGDLERYRATYCDRGSQHTSTAEALYLRALRARSCSGRAPGMLATIASSRGDSSEAVHWAWRAVIASEPFERAGHVLVEHLERCSNAYVQKFDTRVNFRTRMIANKLANQTAKKTGRIDELDFQACEDCIAAAACVILAYDSELDTLHTIISRRGHAARRLLASALRNSIRQDVSCRRRAMLRLTLTAILGAESASRNEGLLGSEEKNAATFLVLGIATELGLCRQPLVVSSALLVFCQWWWVRLCNKDLANCEPIVLDENNTALAECAFAVAVFLNDIKPFARRVGTARLGTCGTTNTPIALDDDEMCCGIAPLYATRKAAPASQPQDFDPITGQACCVVFSVVMRCRTSDDDGDEAFSERAARCLELATFLCSISESNNNALICCHHGIYKAREFSKSANEEFDINPYSQLAPVFKLLDIGFQGKTDTSEKMGRNDNSTPFHNLRCSEIGVLLSAMPPMTPQLISRHRMQAVAPLLMSPRSLLFVLDAANISMRHGSKKKFSTLGIALAINYLTTRFSNRCRFAAFLPEYLLDADKIAAKWRAHKLGIKQVKFQELPDNVLYLQELEHDGILYTTPSQDYDDSYQIEYARRHGGVIVTNDLFRDAVLKLKPHMRSVLRVWMKSHLLSYTFVADEFCPNPDFSYPANTQITKSD